MEDNLEAEQINSDEQSLQEASEIISSESRRKDFIILLLILSVILLIVGLGAFNILSSKSNNDSLATTKLTPTISKIETLTPTEGVKKAATGVTIGKNTISFVEKEDGVYLGFKGKFYKEGKYSADEVENVISNDWIGLVNPPNDIKDPGFNDILSINNLSNGNFMFVSRWDEGNSQSSQWVLKVFHYKDGVVSSLMTTYWPNNNESTVPIIGSLSSDEQYMVLNMHSCWNCGGGIPDTLLLNIETKETKNIGKTSFFEWGENGEYTYREYVKTNCGEPFCPADESLPLKKGQMP